MKTGETEGFQQLLREAEEVKGSKKNVADALELDQAHYSRIAKAGTLNIENCLRLAALLRRRPGDVLRAAGKTDIADLLDTLYGEARYEPLPGGAQAREFVAEWERLNVEQREILLTMIRQMPRESAPVAAEKEAPTLKKKPARSAQQG